MLALPCTRTARAFACVLARCTLDVTAEAVEATPCQHYFHMSCLAEWLGQAQREVDREDCPCCRGRLSGLRRKLVKR